MGFNFTKINIEKFSDNFQNLKINTSIDISEIKELKTDVFKTKEELLGIKFTFNIFYEPDIAKAEFAGNIIISVDSKTAKEILKKWKDKKMPEDFRITLFNVIFRKSNLKALELEDELNLPIHLPLPRLTPEDKKGK